MNEKLAIEILKQATLETTTGACEKCPRKDKNKTCIGCLDDAKDVLLNHINSLQSKINKAIKYIERCNFDNAEILIDMGSEYTYEDGFKDELLDILKENK